jgi:hypothetical protein
LVIKFFIALGVMLSPLALFANEDFSNKHLPKIEAGLALGYFHLPDYPGADEAQTRFLPLPYFIYRGDFIRADRGGGLRGRFLNEERLEFDISFGAAFPVSAGSNGAREGMPELDWIGEVGPRLTFNIARTPIVRLDIALPVRAVFSVRDFEFKDRGFIFEPQLRFRHRALFMKSTSFLAQAGFTSASEELMDYFYEVPQIYQNPTRPTYDAKAGLLSTNASLSIVKAYFRQNVFIFVGVGTQSYTSARNRESPLIKDNTTESYFIGIAWGVYRSLERAVPDDPLSLFDGGSDLPQSEDL